MHLKIFKHCHGKIAHVMRDLLRNSRIAFPLENTFVKTYLQAAYRLHYLAITSKRTSNPEYAQENCTVKF